MNVSGTVATEGPWNSARRIIFVDLGTSLQKHVKSLRVNSACRLRSQVYKRFPKPGDIHCLQGMINTRQCQTGPRQKRASVLWRAVQGHGTGNELG